MRKVTSASRRHRQVRVPWGATRPGSEEGWRSRQVQQDPLAPRRRPRGPARYQLV